MLLSSAQIRLVLMAKSYLPVKRSETEADYGLEDWPQHDAEMETAVPILGGYEMVRHLGGMKPIAGRSPVSRRAKMGI